MTHQLLVEIGCEEIPSGYLSIAREWLEQNAKNMLDTADLLESGAEIKFFLTPRRITLSVTGMKEKQSLKKKKIVGPPSNIAFDQNGNLTKAALGFAKKNNIEPTTLKKDGEYVSVEIEEGGKSADEVLPELLKQVFNSIPFPKTMRWGKGEVGFTRPVHWVLALLGNRVLNFEFAGMKASNVSYGHRFLAPESIAIDAPEAYIEKLRSGFVIADSNERKSLIEREVKSTAQKNGFIVREDKELLETVCNLTEYPVPIMGRFDDKYLVLPEEVLITAMRSHQKYFAVEDKAGKLAPKFITVSNIKAGDFAPIIDGNERVLRARLEDARFFFEEDKQVKLEERAKGLSDVVFHKKLGSYRDRVERIKALVTDLSIELKLKSAEETAMRSAELCKADLLTQMVFEFTELQGVMGREYAIADGETKEVAVAIYEHYLPKGASGELPVTDAGRLLALADKLDIIVSCFGVGLKPSGSQDPFALRRACIGVIRILDAADISISEELIKKHIARTEEALKRQGKKFEKAETLFNDISAFFKGRLDSLWRREFRADLVSAVIEKNWLNPHDAYLCLSGLSKVAGDESFLPLAIAFKRTVNILKQAKEKGIAYPASVDGQKLKEPQEKALYEALRAISNKVSALEKERNYETAFRLIAGSLKAPLDAFFDKVLVMDKEEALRNNRLALLNEIGGLFQSLADFTLIHTEVG